jgi:anti-sigma regulatory factor (Ser/Thr protein kinase)/predicted transcriptional regulator
MSPRRVYKMAKMRTPTQTIKDFILNNVKERPTGISRLTAEEFNISRQMANQHVMSLVKEGKLEASGNTKARTYQLTTLFTHMDRITVTPRLEEHVTWRETIAPYLSNVQGNVLNICQYGFTEMVNNVVSHSNARHMNVVVERDPVLITLRVSDDGVGVFTKIQQAFGYDDPRQALLELAKGKVTSDPDRHTGEGIFFTSKMFDTFSILSGRLFYGRTKIGDGWLIEAEDRQNFDGTFITMEIHPNSTRISKEIFDQYASGDDKDFSRTHVPIVLAKYGKEQLLSRSQARRVLARFERFKEVMLDFQGVEMIGQAFADEIFRVFRREHPGIVIAVLNTSSEVDQMIKHVSGDANGSLRLF